MTLFTDMTIWHQPCICVDQEHYGYLTHDNSFNEIPTVYQI